MNKEQVQYHHWLLRYIQVTYTLLDYLNSDDLAELS